MANKNGNPQNLKPFKKGNPGGPGRPHKLPQLDALMAEIMGEEKDGITVAKSILSKLKQKAVAGDLRASEILLDRAYGKAKQELNITERTIIVELPENDND